MSTKSAATNNPSIHTVVSKYPLPKATTPQLVITKQTCLTEQTYTANGIQKNVHVIIKNNSFHVEVALAGNLSHERFANFHQMSIEASLLYDTPDNSRKEVMFIKVKPLEYSGRIDDKDATKFQLEISVKILSSQHEDSLFRVLLKAVDPATGKPIPGLEATTKELLSISKPEVVRKMNEPRQKKRTRDDVLMEALTRIESKLEGHQQAIDSLLRERSPVIKAELPSPSLPVVQSKVPSKSDDLVTAVRHVISAFHSLESEDRPEKVRKLKEAMTPQESDTLLEIFEKLYAEERQVVAYQSPDPLPFAFDLENGFDGQTITMTDSTEELYKDYLYLPNSALVL